MNVIKWKQKHIKKKDEHFPFHVVLFCFVIKKLFCFNLFSSSIRFNLILSSILWGNIFCRSLKYLKNKDRFWRKTVEFLIESQTKLCSIKALVERANKTILRENLNHEREMRETSSTFSNHFSIDREFFHVATCEIFLTKIVQNIVYLQ